MAVKEKEGKASAINGRSSIIGCSQKKCVSTFQDQKYGPNQRVHNAGNGKFTCTVCGNVRK